MGIETDTSSSARVRGGVGRSFGRPVGRGMAAAALAVLLVAVAAVVGPAGSAASAGTDPGPVAEWGTTTGTDGRVYIADAQGRALQFHGFNIKTAAPADDATEDLLALAASRGMDHVRLGWYWQHLEPEQDRFDESFVEQLITVLDRAEREGLLVILDMHQDVYGDAFGSQGIPAWATRTEGLPFERQESWLLDYLQPAVQAAFDHLYDDADLRQEQIDAWLHVVEAVKDHPALLGYDLLNEPFGRMRPGEDLFTAAERVEREQLTPMYQRLTDAISAVDPDHWVFFEPPNLASLGVSTSLGAVHGPKVAFYPHMYDAAIETATYAPDGTIQLDPAFFDSWSRAITTYVDRNPMPLLVGEWGIAHPEIPGMDVFVERALETLDDVSSGWSMFQMCRGGGYCPFDAEGIPRPGIAQIFQPFAKAIAGRPTSSTWDAETRSLTVRFRDGEASGTTDIYLDAGATYGDRWVVETSDPEGTWSSSYDAESGVLSVTIADDGADHAICVKPAGAAPGCSADAVDPEVPEPGPSTTTPGTTPVRPVATGSSGARPAQPVHGSPRYTG